MIGTKLPHQPESIDQMRARWDDAVSFCVDAEKIYDDPQTAYVPSQHRRHVFDFDDGVRLIVSRDQFHGEEKLHVSVSVTTEFNAKWSRSAKGAAECLMRITEAVQSIGGKDVDRRPDHEAMRANGIIDFFWDLS